MESENIGVKFPTDLVNQAKKILHESESFNELVVQALKQEIKAKTGLQPNSTALIRRLRFGEDRRE